MLCLQDTVEQVRALRKSCRSLSKTFQAPIFALDYSLDTGASNTLYTIAMNFLTLDNIWNQVWLVASAAAKTKNGDPNGFKHFMFKAADDARMEIAVLLYIRAVEQQVGRPWELSQRITLQLGREKSEEFFRAVQKARAVALDFEVQDNTVYRAVVRELEGIRMYRHWGFN